MRYIFIILSIFYTTSVFAQCNINQQEFGISLKTIGNKLSGFKEFERIPNVQQQITTIFEEICPNLEEALSRDTLLHYHFIKNRLVSIQLERASYDDLLLFNWARKYFGIEEDQKIIESQQFLQVEKSDRVIQISISVLADSVYQNVLIVSNQHDDLFEWKYGKDDEIDWENFEVPQSKISEEEN